MINYLINSTLCSGLLLLVYKFFLEHEKMHRFNRFFLLGSVIISLIIPFISFELPENSSPILQQTFNNSVSQITDIKAIDTNFIVDRSSGNSIDISRIIFGIYVLISLIFLAKFTINIFKIYNKITQSPYKKYGNSKLILINEKLVAHSFLSYIFINKTEFENGETEPEILLHEYTHVSQNHSYDILFIELIMSILWINPFVYFCKKAIQLNHEFLADEAVIQSAFDLKGYQYLLLKKAANLQGVLLSSNFNFSTTKTRLIMMTKSINSRLLFFKKLAFFPLIFLCILLFSNCQESKINVENTKNGVSETEMTDYHNSISKYFSITGTKYNTHIYIDLIPGIEQERLLKIFKRMTKNQQNSQDFVLNKISDLDKSIPSNIDYESFKDSSKFIIKINDIPVKNMELNKHKSSDFSYFLKYRTNLKPGLKVNSKFYVDLMTIEHFKKVEMDRKKINFAFFNFNPLKGSGYFLKKYQKK